MILLVGFIGSRERVAEAQRAARHRDHRVDSYEICDEALGALLDELARVKQLVKETSTSSSQLMCA